MSDLEQIVDGEQPELEQVEEAEAVEVEASEAPEQDAEPVVEDATPEPEKAEEPKADQTVPLAAFLEMRQELRELKTLATPRPQPIPAPDVFEDPEGYSKHMQRQLQQSNIAQKLEMSKFMAQREFGAEKVQAMVEYFDQHPDQSQAFVNEPSPFHAAMDHFNQHRVAQEIGNDPVAYRAKLEAEIRSKIEAEMVAKQARDAAGKFAPSMANTTGTGGGPRSNWVGPTDLTSAIGE